MANLTPAIMLPVRPGVYCETWPMLERPGHVGYRDYGRYYKPFGGLYSDGLNTPVPTFPNPFPFPSAYETTQGLPQMTLAFMAGQARMHGGLVEGWGAIGRRVYGRGVGQPKPWAAHAAPFRA